MAIEIVTVPPGLFQITGKADKSGILKFQLQFTVSEDDPTLPHKLLSGEWTWGDGSLPTAFTNLTSPDLPDGSKPPISIIARHDYNPGFYIIKITARNYRVPTHAEEVYIIQLTVEGEVVAAIVPKTVYGPILPRDEGFPNKEQWVLSDGQDLQILASSVKMLLLTRKGERLMNPDYGTTLQTYIFDPMIPDIETVVIEDIRSSLSAYEPRVDIKDLEVKRDGKTVNVNLVLLSKLTNQLFATTLNFTQ